MDALVNSEQLSIGTGWFNLADYYTQGPRFRVHINPGRVDQLLVAAEESDQPIQGVMHELKAGNGTHLIGYFSSHRHPRVDAPDYARSLFVFIDNVVLGNDAGHPKLSFTKRAFTRKFEATSGETWNFSLEYRWPFYKELLVRTMTEPQKFISKDFLSELVDVVASARPDWVDIDKGSGSGDKGSGPH